METEEILNSKWSIGIRDRGLGHVDYAIMLNKEVIIQCPDKEIAFYIIELHNKSL